MDIFDSTKHQQTAGQNMKTWYAGIKTEGSAKHFHETAKLPENKAFKTTSVKMSAIKQDSCKAIFDSFFK